MLFTFTRRNKPGKPIYSSKTNNNKYQKFINWYAIKLI